MSLNETKTLKLHSPLVTPLSITRRAVREVLDAEIGRRLTDCVPNPDDSKAGKSPAPLWYSQRTPDAVIWRLKAAIGASEAGYAATVPYALGTILRMLERTASKLKRTEFLKENRTRLSQVLSFILEVAYFLYRMDARVPTTYKISRIAQACREVARRSGGTDVLLRQEIVDHTSSVLGQLKKADVRGPEILNLLVLLATTGGSGVLKQEELEGYLGIASIEDLSQVDYFSLVSVLFCSKDNGALTELVNRVEQEIVHRFRAADKNTPFRSEIALLFIDSLACPHISPAAKSELAEAMSRALLNRAPSNGEVSDLVRFCANRLSFTDWSRDFDLSWHLARTVRRPAYE